MEFSFSFFFRLFLAALGAETSDESVAGPVALVGADHVALGEEAEPEWFVPLASLAFVRTRDSSAG